eukprot:gene14758-10555_t
MSWTDDVLSGMSAETLAALKEFASLSGIKLDKANEGADKATAAAEEDDDNDPLSILTSLRNHFQLPASERETTYPIHYESSAGIEPRRVIDFSVKGVKRELGQTLDSTGLTIWRAAEHLCQYLIDHPHRFGNKYICELGCGLGLVSILLEKMALEHTRIVATDGDEPTLQLLIENKVENECDFETAYLYWGQDEDFVQEYCHAGKFDVLLAADVIYEDDQVLPLITTASRILKPDGEFILAFARRNVPMDKVLDAATAFNFQYEVLTDEHDTSRTFDGTEPIYRFTWKK